MSTTQQITQFFDTNSFPASKTSWGELKPILNEAIAGAKNVVVELRWVDSGQKFQPEVIDKHQLLYFLEGDGTIHLEGKDHKVGKGAGIYLGPQETASITAAQGSRVKLFHITVPKLPK